MSYSQLQKIVFDWLRNKNINYIARDESGCVFGYKFKPIKALGVWVSEIDSTDTPILVFKEELSFLKWEDETAFEIPILNFTEEQETIFKALKLFQINYLYLYGNKIYCYNIDPEIRGRNHLPYNYRIQLPEIEHLSFLVKEAFKTKAFKIPELEEL